MMRYPVQKIETRIVFFRGQKVILSADLAQLYGVKHKVLMQSVQRNRNRFPKDFMFQLTKDEYSNLKSHFVTSSSGQVARSTDMRWGGVRKLPYAFMEEGVAMLSGILHSQRAIKVNIEIMRAFVRLRHILAEHKELAQKVEALEEKYDGQFAMVFQAIRQLMIPPSPPARRIGFRVEDSQAKYLARRRKRQAGGSTG
jgi:hypothetical protein